MEAPPKKKISEADLEQSFAVIGVPYNAEWTRIHKSYLSLAKKWHPDRSTASPELANEKIREVNKAYSLLKANYRQNNLNTPNAASNSRPDHQSSAKGNYQRKASDAPPQRTSPHDAIIPRTKEGFRTHPKVRAEPKIVATPSVNDRVKSAASKGHIWKPILTGGFGAIAVLAVGAGIFVGVTDLGKAMDPPAKPKQRPVSSLLSNELINKFKAADRANLKFKDVDDRPKYFTLGDSNATVLEVQGSPDLTAASVWYYGDSAVVFEDGKVVSWTLSINSQLKIKEAQAQ